MKKLETSEIQRVSNEIYRTMPKNPWVVVLDNIRSLHNVGSFFRTADAFAIEKIYLCGITGTPPNREIQKTALGATETVAWEYFQQIKEVLQNLKAQDYVIISVEHTDQSISLEKFIVQSQTKYALIFGNEVFGVSPEAIELSDLAIEIPQFGTKHSLNVSVSGGIVLWHFLQHKLSTQSEK
ncbi:MAG: RNA methyltransferase [Raineya sp.]|nr:RNA methyltransferase [Raineya sp.]